MAMTPEQIRDWREKLAERGEDQVRENLVLRRYGPEKSEKVRLAREFLRKKEEMWEVNMADEQVRQQQEALDLARAANRISKWAAFGAAASALFALFALLKSFGAF